MSKSPSLRRIQADIRELSYDPSDRYYAMPLENDMFEWHFTIKGAEGTDFAGGIYHGRILLPPDYPYKPPHIIFLTPSGRFEINTKVCLSFSAYHPELWQPAWGIRLILEALISFLPTPSDGAIGAINYTSTERKKLAIASQKWSCPICGPICNIIPENKKLKAAANNNNNKTTGDDETKSRFQKEIQDLQRYQQVAHANKDDHVCTVVVQEEERKETATGTATGTAATAASINDDDSNNGQNNDDVRGKEAAPAEEQSNSVDRMSSLSEAQVKTETRTIYNEEEKQQDKQQEQQHSKTAVAATAVSKVAATTEMATTTTTTMNDSSANAHVVVDPNSLVGNVQAAQVGDDLPPPTTSFLFNDHLLHGIILVLSVICFMLLRKVQAILADIRALEEESSS